MSIFNVVKSKGQDTELNDIQWIKEIEQKDCEIAPKHL